MSSTADDDTRRDKLRQQYQGWEARHRHADDARTSRACRPNGTAGEPFSTFSFEETELHLSTAGPEAVTP